MNKEFITVDGIVIIKGAWLSEKKLRQNKYAIIYNFGFLALLILLSISLHEIIEEEKYLRIFQVILIVAWLVPSLRKIYNWLFVETWRSAIRISEITSIEKIPLSNTLETMVFLKLKNGRKKTLLFRNAEHQIDEFIIALNNQLTPDLKYSKIGSTKELVK